MSWDFDSKSSIYGQLVDMISNRIITGVYPIGSKLDSVRELSLEAGVNPNTMQRALAELERKGIIYTNRTSGKFVTEDESLIERLKNEKATALVGDLIRNMQQLGFSQKEIEEVIKKEIAK